MKKSVLLILTVFLISCATAEGALIGKLLGVTTNKETHELKNSTEKRFSDISNKMGVLEANNNTLTNELGVMKENVINLENKITANLKADIKAMVEAKAVGYDRSQRTDTDIKQESGRDSVQSSHSGNVNDSNLMEFVVDKWAWAAAAMLSSFVLLFGSVFSLFKWQGRMYERLLDSKQKWIENLVKSNSDKDEKNDDYLKTLIGNGRAK